MELTLVYIIFVGIHLKTNHFLPNSSVFSENYLMTALLALTKVNTERSVQSAYSGTTY